MNPIASFHRFSLISSTLLLFAVACGSDVPAADGPDSGFVAGADAGPRTPAPAISIANCPGTIVLGDDATLSFGVDADHHFRLEGGGQSEGSGTLLDEGEGSADQLLDATVDSELLGIGEHELRLYARQDAEGLGSVAFCTTTIVSSLKVLYLHGYRATESSAMVEAALDLDPRVGAVDVVNYQVVDPEAPSLQTLQEYDTVMFSWFPDNLNSFFSGEAFGNRFADYVDAGGSLVLLGHAMNDTTMLGRLVTGEYVPLRSSAPHSHPRR